jgi:hypothetical protein
MAIKGNILKVKAWKRRYEIKWGDFSSQGTTME